MASGKNDLRKAGTIWVLDLDEPAPAIAPAIAPAVPASFRRLGPELAPSLVAAMGGPLGGASSEVDHRFDTGRRCYAAWVGDRLAAYGWVSFEEEHIGELDLRLKLLPGEAYIYDCTTLPTYRRKGLFSALLAHMQGVLREEPMCRVWIGADLDNLPSQRGIARAGFHPVADVEVRHDLPLRRVILQARPGVPESLAAEARRVFLSHRDGDWLVS